jgi:predicted nucleotidyltransferase
MVDRSVVEAVRDYLRALQAQGLPVRYGILFGSYAIEKADRWSDIDLIVVSPRFDGKRQREDIDLLWRTSARTDSRIEPIPVGERQWLEDDASAIVEIARREGQRITVAGG